MHRSGSLMCFSATASFAGSAVLTGIGAATIAQVRRPGEIPYASLPMLFAAHQLVEGFVWLGLQGHVAPAVGATAAYIYLLYAEGVVPVLVPLAVLLVEPSDRRLRLILPLIAVGLAVAAFLFWVDAAAPVPYRIMEHSIAYDTAGPLTWLLAVLYVVAACGAPLASSHRWIVAFGAANVLGLSVTALVQASGFISLWCAYAAALSVLVLLFFLLRDGGRAQPGPSRFARASR